MGSGSVDRRALAVVVGACVVLGGLLGLGLSLASSREADLHVGAVLDPTTSAPASGGAPVTPPPTRTVEDPADDGPGLRSTGTTRPRRPTGRGVLRPDGRPYGAPVPFDASIRVPDDLVWVLLIGSDARPGEQVLRARADSIHLLAANPRTGQATIIGFPRDSWVDIPGHGPGKINTALVLGGPQLLAATVQRFTGLPVQWWVAAGFATFQRVVDEVGGVVVEVDQRMDDHDSGAHFAPGFHHFDGARALAYSRDRHDFPDGDFTRSENHGRLVLATLAKLRAEVSDEQGLRRWVGFALRHLALHDGVDVDGAVELLAVARRTLPERTTNLVLPGKGGTAGSQSVVYLDAAAVARVADDVRPDAAVGPAGSPTTAPTTTTTGPAPTVTQPPPATSTTTPTITR